MTDIDCEKVQIAAMALSDGEASPLERVQIETHLAQCELCREELQSLGVIDQVLSSYRRVDIESDVWPMVNEQLETSNASATFRWKILLLFGIPLVSYKGLSLLLQDGPNFWFKLVPLLLVIAVFAYLRTNPFKINSELTLSGELSS